MAETEVLLIRQLVQKYDCIQSVSSTSDVKLLSVLDTNHVLRISAIKSTSNVLTLTNLLSFAWQEDNYYLNEYKLLGVDENNEICYYVINLKILPNHGCLLEGKCVSKWDLKKALQQFHQLAKQLNDVSCYDILKFEAKEAVFLFEKKVVVSFFLSAENDPQIMSISDLSEEHSSCKKVLLMKDTLFALDANNYKLSIYSFLNNSKIHDIELSECSFKKKNDPILNFTVNLKMDRVVFVTTSQRLYAVTLDISHITNNSSQTLPNSMVTAFTKQFPSVKRIDDGLRRFSVSTESVQMIVLTCDTSSLILKEFFVLENKLFFLFQGDHQSLVGIHALDVDEPTAYKVIAHQVFFLHTATEEVTFPLLLYFENKISLFVYNIEKDKLVNELMIYPSSGAVEALACLNNWNSIQMDIEVLRLGLRNRKIYTVEFYLKTLFEGFSQQWHVASTMKWFEKMKKECINWEDIIHLVYENIQQNLSDSSTCQYAEQLLQILIIMVIQILHVIEEKATDDNFLDSDKSTILNNFTRQLLQLRTLLRFQELPSSEPPDTKSSTRNLQLCDKISPCWKKWENEKIEDIIKESLLSGTVPQAQSYLHCCCRIDKCPSFEQFQTAAQDLVHYFLRQGLMSEALSVLLNMGEDINIKLIEIFKSTAEKDVRSLMLQELQQRNLLENFDKNLLDFAFLLENLYPCSSFEHARVLLDEKSTDSAIEINCASPTSDKQLTIGDFMTFNEDNSQSGEYCRIVLDWLNHWDDDIKSRILTPHFLKNSPILEFFNKKSAAFEMKPLSVWNYLLETGNIPNLNQWIDGWLQSTDASIFKKWPITEEMIQTIPERATLCVSDQLLNKLARHGIFCEEELVDITSFLLRIGRSQHDVNAIDVYSSQKSSLQFSEIMHKLVHYCLKHDLVHVLFSLLYQNYKHFSAWPECGLCDVPLLSLTKSFYLWTENVEDPQIAYNAMADAAQFIYNLQNSSSTELLENLPFPLCLSIFVFNSQPLLETVREAMENSELSEVVIKEKFRAYPLLSNYLFDKPSKQSEQDVTVYELLKGSTMFDTSQLFGWQPSNKIKSEESMSELPHFSSKSLSEQYGLKKELNYLYYLMQGRPNYAYLKFIQQEVVLETGLSIPRIKSACSDVMDYCLANYRNPEVSMACVLFIELVGQDSLALRACLMAANILHDNKVFEIDKDLDKSSHDIWKMFKLAHQSKDSAAELASELEKITVRMWDPYSIDSNSLVSDICLWMPVMTISYLFEVEAGNKYLHECAKQNKWLKFLVFSQIFQVPKEQVLKAASKFSNSCIYYHVFHALQKKPQQEVVAALPSKTPNDMRKSLYSRAYEKKEKHNVLLRKSPDSEDDRISISSEDTTSSDTDMRSFVLKDLFSQLLSAHNSDVPWESLLHTSLDIQNPVLSVLAASYPDAPLQSCFFVWLYTTLCNDEHTKKQIEPSCTPIRIKDISTDEIEHIIILAIQNKKILIMWQAVQFFLANSPLLPLMEFLKDFLVYKKFESSIESFQNKLWDYPRNNSDQTSVLHSVLWIENISVSILKISVISCSTSYERVLLLKHFSHTRLEKSFSKEVIVPPFMKVYSMLQYTAEISYDIDVQKLFLPENDANYLNECWSITNKLLQLHLFQDAEMFATVARLSLEHLFLLQMQQTVEEARQNTNWDQLSHRIEFWKPILDKLSSTSISIQAAVEFLDNQCEISDMFGEKYFLMKFMIHLLSFPNFQYDAMEYDVADLQRKMWLWCMKAEVNKQITPELLDVIPAYDFDINNIADNKTESFRAIEDNAEKESLGRIIKYFLTNKDPKRAFDLAYTFGFISQDLDIVKTCLKLAKEELPVQSVHVKSPDLNLEGPSSRFIRSLVLWLSSNSSGIASSKAGVMKCIEKLGRKCESALAICHQILVHYVVATVLKRSYDDIASEKDSLSILKQILSKKLSDEYIVAKCFIVVRDLPDRDVAIFLSEEIQHSLKVLCLLDLVLVPEEQLAFAEELIYDPQCTNDSFQLIVKLCQDPSLLGNILMDVFSNETAELSSKSPDKTFSSAVELCICAHECFTAACNMDGISQILHNSQHLVNLLEEAKKFSIMVRLLIGLGRYSEMVWVFDVLKSHDKLSLLFMDNVSGQSSDQRKQNARISEAHNLKLALLDYLKRLPPSEGDTYFYKLAKKFGMHREKAEILEMSVQKQLSLLCKKNLDIDMREDLEKAMNCLAEAAESYCEADCLHQAQNCTRLAQLVALQIYFQPSGIWIIGLDKTSVSRFITDHDNFPQSFIVAEQYGNHQLWNQAVLNNVVCRGDRQYLRDFQAQFGLSTSLITDVVKRYLKLQPKTESVVKNMKHLLGYCRNVKVKYSLALESGFQDIAAELLMGEGASYLQDLIANNVLK